MTSDASQKCGNLRYAITYNVWANQKTESFEYHWLHALAMFDIMSFPAIFSAIGLHFKFWRYVNWCYTLKTCKLKKPINPARQDKNFLGLKINLVDIMFIVHSVISFHSLNCILLIFENLNCSIRLFLSYKFTYPHCYILK